MSPRDVLGIAAGGLALNLAVDKERVAAVALLGAVEPVGTMLRPGMPGYDASRDPYGFDAERARAALARSRYGGPEGLPPIVLATRVVLRPSRPLPPVFRLSDAVLMPPLAAPAREVITARSFAVLAPAPAVSGALEVTAASAVFSRRSASASEKAITPAFDAVSLARCTCSGFAGSRTGSGSGAGSGRTCFTGSGVVSTTGSGFGSVFGTTGGGGGFFSSISLA